MFLTFLENWIKKGKLESNHSSQFDINLYLLVSESVKFCKVHTPELPFSMKKLVLLFIVLFALANILPAQAVYVTNTGKKYHVASCKYLSSSKITIDLNTAIKMENESA